MFEAVTGSMGIAAACFCFCCYALVFGCLAFCVSLVSLCGSVVAGREWFFFLLNSAGFCVLGVLFFFWLCGAVCSRLLLFWLRLLAS
jgi:hypothetical protein